MCRVAKADGDIIDFPARTRSTDSPMGQARLVEGEVRHRFGPATGSEVVRILRCSGRGMTCKQTVIADDTTTITRVAACEVLQATRVTGYEVDDAPVRRGPSQCRIWAVTEGANIRKSRIN